MKAVTLLVSLFVALHGYTKGFTFINGGDFHNAVQDGMNKFAMNLYKTALKNETGNFITCPFSAFMALAMASYGAGGETKKELQQVLQLPKQTEVATILGTKECIKEINRKFNLMRYVMLRVSNKVFAGSEVSMNPQYQNILENTFNSPSVQVNFGNPEQAAELINSWSHKSSFGRIPEIVNANDLDSHTKLMLVNSAYFLGEWKVPFDPKETNLRPFIVNKEVTKQVPTMNIEANFQLGELPEMNAEFLVLPYQDGGNPEESTYMYIILPTRGKDLAKVEDKIDSLTLKDLQKTWNSEVLVSLPKFRIEKAFKLKEHLTQLGVKRAFTDSADFDEMTDNHENLRINQVVQKTFIGVDEARTEAAAITSFEATYLMMPLTFTVDRPFLVVLATKDVILFTGKVVDPSL